ncbi:hypothetical protein ACWEQ7_15010 [Streptomyces sp. NPDC004069]
MFARLGDPRSIAASALGESPTAVSVRRRHAVVPLVLLALAGTAAVTVPVAGVVLAVVAVVAVWATPQWQTREKGIGKSAQPWADLLPFVKLAESTQQRWRAVSAPHLVGGESIIVGCCRAASDRPGTAQPWIT